MEVLHETKRNTDNIALFDSPSEANKIQIWKRQWTVPKRVFQTLHTYFRGVLFFATVDLFILPDTCLSTESFFHLMRISITLTLYISRLHDGLVFPLFLAVLVSVTRMWHLLLSWAHGTCSSQLPWYSKLLTTIVRSELWKMPSRLINSVGRKSIKANPCTDIHREVSKVRLHW